MFFVTICAHLRLHLFGRVIAGEPPLVERSALGGVVQSELLRSSELRPGLKIDTAIVMPNHLHVILWLAPNPAAVQSADDRQFARIPKSLAAVIAGFKASVTSRASQARLTTGPVWQRNHFERVIRNERELDALRTYIVENPCRWVLKASGHLS